MKIFTAAALVAAIALPLGFAVAGPLKGHPHLEKARNLLDDAYGQIVKSQESNEHVWKDEGGHGKEAKQKIEEAKEQLKLAAEWVNKHEK